MHYPRIRDLREDADRTQGETAALLYMQREVYRRYETGEREPPCSVMIAIADLYGVSLDYLTSRSDCRSIAR